MSIETLKPGIEAKYTFGLGEQPLILALLKSVCRPDGEFPYDRINSAYFDTSKLSLLAEKLNSDYVKTKVRLRWYGNPEPGEVVPAFLEMKRKFGVRRTKARKRLDMDATHLIEGKEAYPVLAGVSRYAGEIGWTSSSALHPMVVIRYLRHRFIEPESGARIALDSQICFSSLNGVFFPGTRSRTLRHGVLEVKTESGDLPRSLQMLNSRVNSRDSFSKYEECWNIYGDTRYRREFASGRGG